MTPIEQIRPSLPGNWTRRPDGRGKPEKSVPGARDKDKKRSEDRPGDKPDDREHHVDELA